VTTIGRALRVLAEGAAILLCAVVIGSIPGSVVPVAVVEDVPLQRLPPGPDQDASLDVVVRDAASHEPISVATVRVMAVVGDRALLARSGATSGSGTLHLEGLPRGEVWVLADAPGKARGTSQLVLEGGVRSLALDLGPAFPLEVDVGDDRGDAIAGAEIEVAGADPLPVGARTGTGGQARVERLGPPPWIVTARATGYEEVVQRSVREPSLRVTLRKLGAILVTVLEERDEPVVGASVQIAGTDLWPARLARTGEHGTVRIGGLAAGTYALRATKDTRVSPIELGVPLARGAEAALMLHLAAGRTIAVHVTDATAGSPVGGAHVSLAEAGLSPFPLEATTDGAGRATLGPIAAGVASLGVAADGFVDASRTVDGQERGPVEVALVRGGTLEGRVVDARGFPVDGATIEVVGSDTSGGPIDDDPRRARFRDAHFEASLAGPRPLIPSGELGVVPGPVPPIPNVFSAPPSRSSVARLEEPWVTRADGTFRIGPVSPGRVRALVRHPQFVEAQSDLVTLGPGREAHVDVVMHAGGNLEGRVQDSSGRPVSGARVAVAAARGSMERSVRTASDGTFAFAALPDAITLTATGEEGAATRVTLTVPEGATRSITLTLPVARLPLPVRVTDDRGYPLDAAQITAASLEQSSPLRLTTFTDRRGQAEIVGSRGLPLRVEVRAPGHATWIATTDPAKASLDVTLGLAASATGEVRAARGGDPIADAEVVLYTDVGAHRARTDRNGSFSLSDLAPGPARLRIRAQGYAGAARDVVVDEASTRPMTFPRTELVEEGIVTGTVVDARGDPIAGARVAKDQVATYLVVGTTPAGIAVADARGRFRLGELAEGTITLEAYAPDLGRARIEGIRVVSGRTTDGVRLVLRGGAEDASPDVGASGGVAVTLGETSGDPREVVLVAVAEGSEAERAGLAPGDTVLEVDGVQVHTIAGARARLSGPLSADVVVRIRRDDREESLRVGREPVRR
jgi:protocatechuate 3,4-dioxygenase beta subunit